MFVDYKRLTKQCGVSLIEVLITTLVLGIGLLGVAALQVSSVSSNQEGFYVSQATSIAEDYAARVRTSKISSMLYYKPEASTYAAYIGQYKSGSLSCGAADTAPTHCQGSDTTCTLEQLAKSDQWDVCQIAKETLPEGSVEIKSIADSNRLSVIVEWTPGSAREDTGNKMIQNSNCADGKSCVIVEIMP